MDPTEVVMYQVYFMFGFLESSLLDNAPNYLMNWVRYPKENMKEIKPQPADTYIGT